MYAIVKVKPNTMLNIDFISENSSLIGDDVVWLAQKMGGNMIKLISPGYGVNGDYGNGAAYIFDHDSLKLLTPWCLINSPLLDCVIMWKR